MTAFIHTKRLRPSRTPTGEGSVGARAKYRVRSREGSKNSRSWTVCLYCPGEEKDMRISHGCTEAQAREEAARMNRMLLAAEGVPKTSPFSFYYVCPPNGTTEK